MYSLYSMFAALAVLLSSPWWLLNMARHGKYRAGLRERLGRVPLRIRPNVGENAGGRTIWIHAVSVGEVLAITGVVERLRQEFPSHRILVSTTTQTGQELARKRFGERNVTYFPLDFAFCIRPYLNVLRPGLIILAETELWPNFLRLAKSKGARIAVVNARISDRSYPRYRRWRGLLQRLLNNIDVFCAQTDEDARRLRDIGAPAERVNTSGNLKFDIAPPLEVPLVARLRAAIGQGGAGPVIVCGSMAPGEEDLLLNDFVGFVRPDFPKALMILAPRRQESFDEVAARIRAIPGLPLVRRSTWKDAAIESGVFLLDSIGELPAVYELADVAVVGGSFEPFGGHNVLEPAYFAKPIVIGPYYNNFRDIVEQFIRADAIVVCDKGYPCVADLLRDKARSEELGRRAQRVLQNGGASREENGGGATERTLQQLRFLVRPQGTPAVEGSRL